LRRLHLSVRIDENQYSVADFVSITSEISKLTETTIFCFVVSYCVFDLFITSKVSKEYVLSLLGLMVDKKEK